MKLPAFLWIIVIPLFCTPYLSAQISSSTIKKELEGLKGSAYLKRAFRGAEEMIEVNEFNNAMFFLNKGVKKAKSMGENPEIAMLLNKSIIIVERFPSEVKYYKEFIKATNELIKKDPPLDFINRSISIVDIAQSKAPDKLKSKVEDLAQKLTILLETTKKEVVEDQKKIELKEFKKMKKEEAFEELEKLKTERERLEMLQIRLSQAIDENEELLSRRTTIINNMTKEQAKKEAIIQFNKRVIDSLNFTAKLDSMALISNERLINEQESRLALQASTLKLKDSELNLKNSRQKLFASLAALGLLLVGFLSWVVYANKKNYRILENKNIEIEKEKERSEALLLNILPKYIANELKENAVVQTRMIAQCTVVFTDFVNFSQISKELTPQELIGALDECFRSFDEIVSRHNIEKIKTIGDSYMCAGGVPVRNDTHAIDAVNAAFEMIEFLDQWNAQREEENKPRFDARIGIHSGSIISGVVGAKKFAYDIWGDTVNIAARLESTSAAQKINISDTTYQLIKNHYQCIKRGSLSVKNMTDLEMYFVEASIA